MTTQRGAFGFYQDKPEVLHQIQDFLQEHGIKTYFRMQGVRNSFGKKPHYRLESGDCHAATMRFCRAVFPYLVVKRIQVQDWMRFRTAYPKLTHQQRGLLGAEVTNAKRRLQ